MAFNGFPYVNFSDLNLDWLLSRIQDVLTLVNSANDKSDNAVELATEANNRTLTYRDQIAGASADAEKALSLAQDSQDILVIYPDNEGKPVNYKKYINGETEYIGTGEILTELTLYKRIPFFMDRNQNIFILDGFLDSGTSNTKARFVRAGGAITFFAIIDSNQTITYNSAEEGSLYNVSFNYSNGGWDSDKTFSQILSAINSGKVISLTIKYNGEIRDVVTGTHFTSSSPDIIYFGFTQGVSEVSPLNAYSNAFAYFTINSNEVVTQQAVKYVPNSSTQISGYVLTVNSNGIPEWLPASGGGGTAVQEIVWGYEDEEGGNAVIRKRSDNSVYTASQMATDATARKLILIKTVHGLYYLSSAGTILGASLATFFNGGTYTMAVDNSGIYTETPVAAVPIPEITNSNTTIQINIDPNKFYVFPNAEQLTINFNAGTSGVVNEYHFRFTSGSTATQLDIPDTVQIPDDFDVAANTVYEISIVDNYMVYSSWAVTT